MNRLPQGKRLFRLAVMGDTHIEAVAPGRVEPRSNQRARHVVEAINGHGVDLAIHLGDLVHPVPGQPGRKEAVEAARAIMDGLKAPWCITPGNHDIGDKPLAWMPAKTVQDDWVQAFEAEVGGAAEVIDRSACRLLFLKGPLLNAGTPLEQEERQRFQSLIADGSGRRFLFTHYPPYLLGADELSHYDNLDEPGRSWLLDLLERHGVEAVFSGHVHNLFYDRNGPTEFWIAPSTSFVRRDYSELFRIGPLAERGREDPDKLGFLLVDVHEVGHATRFVPLSNELTTRAAVIGVELDHPWCETVQLPCHPPTDAFQRRRVRNDYPLMALWRLGITRLRLPVEDLLDRATRQRLHLLKDRGFSFSFFGYGLPKGPLETDLIDAFELVLDARSLPLEQQPLPDVPVLLAPLGTSQARLGRTGKASHFVGFGFASDELGDVPRHLEGTGFSGFTCRVRFEEALEPAIEQAATLAAHGWRVHLTSSLMPAMPEGHHGDDEAITRRVAETAEAAAACPEVQVFLDTFMDVDRGYYTRHGLIDRRCNPRPAAFAIAGGEGR